MVMTIEEKASEAVSESLHHVAESLDPGTLRRCAHRAFVLNTQVIVIPRGAPVPDA